MAKKILINKKTGKEFHTTNPDVILKKTPNTFKVKPDTKLAKEIEVKEATIVKASEDKPKEKKKETSTDKKD